MSTQIIRALKQVENGLLISHPGSSVPIIEELSVRFSRSTLTAIIGRSGSGKTTVLKALLGTLPGQHGNAAIRSTSSLQVGYIPAQPSFIPGSIAKNITLGEAFTRDLVRECLRLVGMEQRVSQTTQGIYGDIGTAGSPVFSSGELQRIAIARTLIRQPDIILMDEPTSALDPEATEALVRLILKIKEGKTVVIATHCEPIINAADCVLSLDTVGQRTPITRDLDVCRDA